MFELSFLIKAEKIKGFTNKDRKELRKAIDEINKEETKIKAEASKKGSDVLDTTDRIINIEYPKMFPCRYCVHFSYYHENSLAYLIRSRIQL